MIQIRKIPGRQWNPTTKCWEIPDNPGIERTLETLFPGDRIKTEVASENPVPAVSDRGWVVEVTDAKLLGFHKGERIRGHEKGLVLVRSLWLANVRIHEWDPEPETQACKLVSPDQLLSELTPSVFLPLHHRALLDAGLLKD